MDYKGRKVWFFRVIPLVYASNQVEWAVDIDHPIVNKLANFLVTASLHLCDKLDMDVTLTPRHAPEMVKNRSTFQSSSSDHMVEF